MKNRVSLLLAGLLIMHWGPVARAPIGRLSKYEVAELTLQPQPVLHYASEKDGIIDGAVFSLTVLTDPESWLVIEAIKGDDGEPYASGTYFTFHTRSAIPAPETLR